MKDPSPHFHFLIYFCQHKRIHIKLLCQIAALYSMSNLSYTAQVP